MTAVVVAAAPVSRSPSSADFSARCFPKNVTCYVPFHSSPSLFSSSSPKLLASRKNGRRSRRTVLEGTSRRNARLTRANAQGGESVSMARISWVSTGDECKLVWVFQKQKARRVKYSAMRQTTGSNVSEFVQSSDSHDLVARDEESAWPKLRRNSSDKQQYNGSLAAKKHSRAPLPTQNQQYRLHNEVTVFEGVRQPRMLGRPGDTRAHYSSLPGHADDVMQQGSELRQRHQKGALFTSKLEEVLSILEKKNNFIKQSLARRGDSTSSMHTVKGPRDKKPRTNGDRLSLEWKDAQGARLSDSGNPAKDATRTIANGHHQGQHGDEKDTSLITRKGLPSDLGPTRSSMKKTARGDETGFTSFNLFSSSPTVPWEADRSRPSSFKPKFKNRGPLGRRLPTSIGSRSSPSQRSVVNRNKVHPSSQAATVVGGDSEVSTGEIQKDLCLDGSNTEGDKVKTLVGFQSRAQRLAEQVESNQKLDSHKEDIVIQGAQRVKNDKLITQGSPRPVEQVESLFDWSDSDVEQSFDIALSTNLAAEKVVPFKSSPVSSSLHRVQNQFYSDSEDDIDDVFESSKDAEDDISTPSSFVKMEGRTAYGTSQLNSSERYPVNMKHNLAEAKISTEHTSLATPATDASPNAFETCNGGSTPTSETWHKHNLPDLPFEFQFSYTETPKQAILGYRETPFSPFGPSTMGRPWIGDRPHKPSKKKQRVFDSFKPPAKDIKGVKFVQDPGPYPEGQGPRAAKSREEIMGEPLTKEEIVYLVEKCKREKRQLNLGRDGLTHNMLDLIHSYWKRRRVCRIKCKGVPTVDIENVKFHIEDKTGGKIIYHAGGVLYLFRGRNYNYKDRPNIPLMLWKPPTPIYPQLIEPAPEGLTKQEADRLRRLGRKVEPICKLGKNGVYVTLVDEVRAAFRVDDLVRVDCRGLNPSDYKKIGAKLRDLVPCVLLSFDKEHILMWKMKEDFSVEGTCVSQSPDSEGTCVSQSPDSEVTLPNTNNDAELSVPSNVDGDKKIFKHSALVQDPLEVGESSIPLTRLTTLSPRKDYNSREKALPLEVASKPREHKRPVMEEHGGSDISGEDFGNFRPCEHERAVVGDHTGVDILNEALDNSINSELTAACDENILSKSLQSGPSMHEVEDEREAFDSLSNEEGQVHVGNSLLEYVVDIDGLWEHAFQCGMAIELSDEIMDSDQIIRKADELAQSAPLAPTYTTKLMYRLQLKRDPDYKPTEDLQIRFGRGLPQKPKIVVNKRKPQLPTVDVPRMGGLPVDELAKLLVKQ